MAEQNKVRPFYFVMHPPHSPLANPPKIRYDETKAPHSNFSYPKAPMPLINRASNAPGGRTGREK